MIEDRISSKSEGATTCIYRARERETERQETRVAAELSKFEMDNKSERGMRGFVVL